MVLRGYVLQRFINHIYLINKFEGLFFLSDFQNGGLFQSSKIDVKLLNELLVLDTEILIADL